MTAGRDDRAAAWLYEYAQRDRGLDGKWADCPEDLRDGWRRDGAAFVEAITPTGFDTLAALDAAPPALDVTRDGWPQSEDVRNPTLPARSIRARQTTRSSDAVVFIDGPGGPRPLEPRDRVLLVAADFWQRCVHGRYRIDPCTSCGRHYENDGTTMAGQLVGPFVTAAEGTPAPPSPVLQAARELRAEILTRQPRRPYPDDFGFGLAPGARPRALSPHAKD